MRISIIIPVFNEERTLEKILEKMSKLNLGMRKEILIINDGSTDNSRKIIEDFIKENKKEDIKVISKKNEGKGSAIRVGIKLARGEIITIQDADLEYDPNDFKTLIKPIVNGKEKVVYGSRFLKAHKPMYKIYFLGNKFLSFLTKVLYGHRITDMETCYKVFDAKVIKSIDLRANKFDIEPEITSKILKKGIRIKEIPISYSPRKIEEGKKINWKDGIQAIFTLLYWRAH
ncbi:glycosyltransferase family 2 protein [Candidatus Pacearchaeota archaeon]|nr:glycosyltransferase family 2 protein [Candidatus Pacearchaeota archaeon]